MILHPESLYIEEVYPEVQGKPGYNPEEMEGTCFTDYCTNKDVAYSIKNWLEQEKTEKLAIETDISIKIGDQLCVSLQISFADNRLFVKTLIDVLAKQLSADYTVESDASGTHFSLSFKNPTDITWASANVFPV